MHITADELEVATTLMDMADMTTRETDAAIEPTERSSSPMAVNYVDYTGPLDYAIYESIMGDHRLLR